VSKDPTSQYVWWAPLKDLQLRELWRLMIPRKLTPKQKRRMLWFYAVILLVELLLAIYIWILLSRTIGP
jgi:hypothetical protein